MIDNEALSSIEKLHEMKAGGIISEEEFAAAKQRLLLGQQKAALAGTDIGSSAIVPAASDHLTWMILPLKRYAEFTGRSSRKEFWMFQLLFVAAFIVCAVLSVLIGAEGAAVLLALGLLGTVVPLIAVEVRRFHDQGKSGWFVLLNIIPYIGWAIVCVFMLLPGAEDDNKYGPNPIS
jgi:uncharacterized membrane protein YhaH (DUF805 family)